MSGLNEVWPKLEEFRAVQIGLSQLDDISESEPRMVIEATSRIMPMLATWRGNDAYAWALALRAKAFRLTDDLPGVLDAARSGLQAVGEDGIVAAHLHLEAGMALNQFGRQQEAAGHLRAADRAFEGSDDDSGRAWALVSLAEAYSGTGYQEDPEPVLRLARELAVKAEDLRAARRAWKQLAVVHRHRGEVPEALEAIHHALDGMSTAQTRANYVLELGHLLAMSGDHAGADEAYEDAAAAYGEYGDMLGQANTERALAENALILGRNKEGLRRLDRAVELYPKVDSTTGLGYVLRERALVRLTEGDHDGALTDAEEGLACFRQSPDSLGRVGMLRTVARVRHVMGDDQAARAALAEARTLSATGTNPLGEAGVLSMEAEIAETATLRLAAANASAELYRRMGIGSGESFALSYAAWAHVELRDAEAAVGVIRNSAVVLRSAREGVVDPGRRADHDFALRDVTTNLLTAAVALGTRDATSAAADLLVDAAPLGLRHALESGQLDSRVRGFLVRVKDLPPRSESDTRDERHLLQQLSALLATLGPQQRSDWISFEQLVGAHTDAAVLVLGAPTRDGALPIAWTLPGGVPHVELVPLSEAHVEQVDALGYAVTAQRAEVLWNPQSRAWQTDLTGVFVPGPVQDWIRQETPVGLVVSFPSILGHVPIEALLIDGTPLGVLAAVTRLPVPTTKTVPAEPLEVVAYLDPALTWAPERGVLPRWVHDAAELRAHLGPQQLIVVGCHGESALRAEGALVASDGVRVADAIDLLDPLLTGSVVVLEACFSGRYMGPRSGEQLNLATIALLAGASAAIAGLFALPADDECTGMIASSLVRELLAGTPPAEAMRRSRRSYWEARPDRVCLPGLEDRSMPGDAPWAWAGMCVYGR